MTQRPTAIGLFLCEQVIVEERTRNVTPVNCFSFRDVEQLPSELLPFVVFALLTDGLGDVPLEVLIQRLDTMEEIYRAAITLRFTNPLHTFRCTLRVRGCSFPVAGHYQASLLAGGELVAQRRFAVRAPGESA